MERKLPHYLPHNGRGLSWLCNHTKYVCVHIGEGVVLPVEAFIHTVLEDSRGGLVVIPCSNKETSMVQVVQTPGVGQCLDTNKEYPMCTSPWSLLT